VLGLRAFIHWRHKTTHVSSSPADDSFEGKRCSTTLRLRYSPALMWEEDVQRAMCCLAPKAEPVLLPRPQTFH
jgi:hypothetical protein